MDIKIYSFTSLIFHKKQPTVKNSVCVPWYISGNSNGSLDSCSKVVLHHCPACRRQPHESW